MPYDAADHERRVARLEDIEAIRRLKCEYAGALDAMVNEDGPDEPVVDLFAEDAIWKSENVGCFQGRAEIVEFLQMFRRSVSFSVNFMLNHRIKVSPERTTATGRWTTWAPLTLNGQPMLLAGLYDDLYRRGEDGRWKFTSVDLRVKFVSNYKVGWADQRISPDWKWKSSRQAVKPNVA